MKLVKEMPLRDIVCLDCNKEYIDEYFHKETELDEKECECGSVGKWKKKMPKLVAYWYIRVLNDRLMCDGLFLQKENHENSNSTN